MEKAVKKEIKIPIVKDTAVMNLIFGHPALSGSAA